MKTAILRESMTAELATDHVELAQAHPGIILFAS